MQVHRQRCQRCHSIELHDLLVRKPGKNQIVLVVCAACRELVARYELSSYYHHGKGIDSWLGSFNPITESAHDLRESFERVRDDAMAELEEAVSILKTEGKAI